MSKVGNFIIDVEEYVQQFVDAGITDNQRILSYVKSVYGSLGMATAQDYLDRLNGVDYDYSPY